jgi:hypothetical protein
LKEVYPIPKRINDHHKKLRLKEKTKCFKTCSKCGETKSISGFPVDRRRPDGHSGICKTCRNKYYQARYARDKEKIMAFNKKYREDHKESYQKYIRKYREDHKKYFKDLARKHYLKNREAIIEKSKKYYQEHEQACLARGRIWRIKNKERIREYNKKYKLKHKIASF